MKAEVDKELCTGCSLCCDTCSEVFEMEGDLAILKADEVPAEAEERCRQAADECPVEAIKIIS